MTAVPARGAAADLAGIALTLARRFAAGATMWCVSPDWPEHAHHVAVEFVHPVIMGKRALPAVAVVDDDPVSFLRVQARRGDVVVVIGRESVAAALGARAGADLGGDDGVARLRSSTGTRRGRPRRLGRRRRSGRRRTTAG